MAALPEPLLHLIAALTKLPGIGPRSAERIALHLVQTDAPAVDKLSHALVEARQKIGLCETCGSLTELGKCGFCQDPRRDSSLVCVVERPVDVFTMEKANSFRGRYHVLGGRISPLNGVQPEDLRISQLEGRLKSEPIQEVILALGTDVEGDATAFYLARRLGGGGVRVSRLAHGLPAGSGLEYADEVTLGRALEGRRELL
jgi:recombination protein RecR